MEPGMISEKLKKVILSELELDDFPMEDNMTASEVPNWDSLNHINIILAIEKEFRVKFKGAEILKVKNIGELQGLVVSKMAS